MHPYHMVIMGLHCIRVDMSQCVKKLYPPSAACCLLFSCWDWLHVIACGFWLRKAPVSDSIPTILNVNYGISEKEVDEVKPTVPIVWPSTPSSSSTIFTKTSTTPPTSTTPKITPTPSEEPESQSGEKPGMSGGAIAGRNSRFQEFLQWILRISHTFSGIVVGILLGVAAIVTVVIVGLFILKRRWVSLWLLHICSCLSLSMWWHGVYSRVIKRVSMCAITISHVHYLF